MKEIFTARMDSKKIPGILKSRVLLPIELRILEMKGYESIPIDTNEVSLLKTYYTVAPSQARYIFAFYTLHIIFKYLS